MTDTRNDLPPVTSPNFLEKVREALSTYLGNRGSKLDRGLTVRDLADAGLVDLNQRWLQSGGKVPPISGPGSAIGGADVYEPDLTPPPTPSGFAATAAISNLLIECAPQTYTQGHGHAKSRLYGATWTSGPLPVFADAVVITEFSGTVASHATNPATTWHLWLTWVTVDGVESVSPAGGTNGVVTRTGEDVALLLEALSGEITASQLHNDLGTRIDLIDGTGAGSVAARIATESAERVAALSAESLARANALALEASTRSAAIAQEAADRAEALLSEANSRGTAIANEAFTRESNDNALATSISLITAGVAGGFDVGQSWYFDSATEGWTSSGGTQSWNAGYVDLVSTGADPQFLSPAINVSGSAYSVIKARVRRLAGSGWDGTAYYATAGHAIGEGYKKVISQPSVFGVGDTVVLEWDMSTLTVGGVDWTNNSITRIRLDLGASAADAFAVDWVAVGRNAPGASQAGLLAEQTARVNGDTAEALSRQTLATQMRGGYTGTDVAQLTSGLIHSERNARSSADSAIASDVSALSTTVTNNFATLSSAITNEATTRASADTAEANSRNTLQTKLIGAANPDTATLGSLTSGLLYDERTSRSTADATEVTARQLLSSTMLGSIDPAGKTLGNVTSGIIFDERQTRANADAAIATRTTTLEGKVDNPITGLATKASVFYVDTAKADAISASATASQALVSSIKVGGRNLLADSAAERRGGNEYLLYANLSPVFDLHGLGEYVISFDIKSSTEGSINVYTEDRDTNLIEYIFPAFSCSATTEYQRVSKNVTVANNTLGASHTSLAFYGAYGSGRIPTVKNVKIERGNVATAWTPAPEDTDAAINAVNATLVNDYSTTATMNSAISTATTALASTVASNQATALTNYRTAATQDTVTATAIANVSARLNSGGDTFTAIANTQTTVNTKSATFAQGTTPTATKTGDLWIDTSDSNKLKTWNGSTWALADDQRIGSTASQVTTLQSSVSNAAIQAAQANFIKKSSFADGSAGGWNAAGVNNDTVSSPWGNFLVVNTRDTVEVGNNISVTEGERIFASAYITTWASEYSCSLGLMCLDATGAVGYWLTLAAQSPMTGWSIGVRCTGSAVIPIGIYSVAPWIQINGPGGQTLQQCWVNDPYIGRFERGATSNRSDSTTDAAITAAVQVEATTRAAQTGELYAQYTVKLDVGGKVSGYGLASTGPTGAGSTFAIRADRFYIAPPAGSAVTTDIIPFAVQATATTINGVSVPAGVYINDAYIKNGTITNAKIGNAQIDDAKIASLSAAKLTIGDGTVGGDLKSVVFDATRGWKIQPNGTATFNNAVVRGTVYATAGEFTGELKAATGSFTGNVSAGQFTTGAFTSPSWPAAGSYGTYLGPSGLLLGNYHNGKWFHVYASGNITAPGFSVTDGVFQITQLNVIDTLHLRGEALIVSNAQSSDVAAVSTGVTLTNTNGTGAIFVTVTSSYIAQGSTGNTTAGSYINLKNAAGTVIASSPLMSTSVTTGYTYSITVAWAFRNLTDGYYSAAIGPSVPLGWAQGPNSISMIGIKR